ncbi:MAG: 16S rRNA (guanine(527)-N(7))-methyltransferase RsmG [Acidobacteria bacterium]|nr:16S rRNA (guanine(527)-N(7))-methyltransferase RsmG [Acidobacteriota bacterium]
MGVRDFRTRLSKRAAKARIPLTAELIDKLTAYYELLARWNKKINLTALEDPDAAIDRLLLEPVAAARHVAVGATRLMDVGSGGGSPAIPLKLAANGLGLTMVEVKARKSAFLREAVRHLGLSDTTVETSRFEELLSRPELHERFDVLSLRAVRLEPRMLNTIQAFVRPGGQIMLFQGPTRADIGEIVVHPLEWTATHTLAEPLQSRLTVLTKRARLSR